MRPSFCHDSTVLMQDRILVLWGSPALLVHQHLVVATVFNDLKSWDSANAQKKAPFILMTELGVVWVLPSSTFSLDSPLMLYNRTSQTRGRSRKRDIYSQTDGINLDIQLPYPKPWPEKFPLTISSTPYYCRITLPTNINRSLLSWLLIP